MTALFVERENEILEIIRSFADAGLEFVVVGGYAVSGFGRHRFSVDLDVVIDEKDLEVFTRILEERVFSRHAERAGFDEAYGGRFVSYVKRIDGLPVTADLLVGSLVCRATGASWSYEYMKSHSIEAEVAGIELSARCRVPERELLIALKIHSGRRADLRDMVMLMGGAEVDKIVRHLKRGDIEKLKTQIGRILGMLGDPRLVDSLEGVFTIQRDVTGEVKRAYRVLEKIREVI
ncbi:MAG: hypothetical protein KIH10_12730 [Candidatus Freyarchaeota archaeon]|nr:hypothetical protein [Candidatus Jordarchaeia archaeon]MBS7279577.1 hypothetical protein [Candidatus Jordarchaeia archaeon]